jgi:hypothetical protein
MFIAGPASDGNQDTDRANAETDSLFEHSLYVCGNSISAVGAHQDRTLNIGYGTNSAGNVPKPTVEMTISIPKPMIAIASLCR